jgi:hypothetical protein
VDLNPLPVLFSEKDFKSNFRLSGNFVPVGQFFSGQPLNVLQIGSRKWGVGVKWLGGGRLGKMAARSDAARQTPPGVIARVLSQITPNWTQELTTRTLGVEDANACVRLSWPTWNVCVHEMAMLVATSLEKYNNKSYKVDGRKGVVNVSIQLKQLERWLEFNSLDFSDVDRVSKEPLDHVSRRHKCILPRNKEAWQHKDKRVAVFVEEACVRMLSKSNDVWHAVEEQ